jgi:two-component system, response regulator, stage 0 sporulation protein F
MKTEPMQAVIIPRAPLMKRILIVDDESLIRCSLSAALRQDDTQVKAVPCGKDALGEIDTVFYDLCFLDVNLPDIYGLDLMKTIKKSSPSTKIIIMTAGVVDEPELVQSIQANANLFLSKPFDLDCVKLFVDRIIGHGTPMRGVEDHCLTGREAYENQRVDGSRQCERKIVMPSATCSVIVSDGGVGETRFTAGILEISERGMSIRTEWPLKPGQLLRFSDIPVLSTGVVRWSKGGGAEESYHAGIQFIMPEDPSHLPFQQAQAGADG